MKQSTPIWRNPYIWGFLIGITVLTAMRPLLRREPPPPPIVGRVPPFELIDHTGAPFGAEQMRDRVWVVDFIFTRCRTYCPVMTRRMAKLQEGYDLYKVDEVGLLSISVDPEYDTPEILRDYAELHGAGDRWRFLTGDAAAVRELMVDGFKLHVGAPETEGESLIDIAHSQKFVLVDGNGAIRGYYDSATEEAVDEVFHRSRHVVRAMEKDQLR